MLLASLTVLRLNALMQTHFMTPLLESQISLATKVAVNTTEQIIRNLSKSDLKEKTKYTDIKNSDFLQIQQLFSVSVKTEIQNYRAIVLKSTPGSSISS